jgi:serine/threonine protein kinase
MRARMVYAFFLQIKREISTMKLIRHPNVIRMYEVCIISPRNYSSLSTPIISTH